jgi:hypothetical protein
VAGALSGLVIHELPDDELDRYRPAISRVDAEAVQAAAAAHLDPDGASVVVVGDAERWVDALRDAGLGEVAIVRDDGDDGGVGGGGREVA